MILVGLMLLQTLAPTPKISANDLLKHASQVPKELFYAAQDPSGTMFCDKALKRRQTRLFDEKYGDRFNRLMFTIRMRDGLGWGPDDIVVVPCLNVTRSQADALLDDFEADLSAFETRYGLTDDVR